MGRLGRLQAEAGQVEPVISHAAALATGRPVTFSTNGTERLARGLASSTYSRSPLKANWTLRIPITPRARPRRAVASSTAATWSAPRVMGGSIAGRVAGVDAGLLDVLHHPADQHRLGHVAEGVDVDLDRVLQEPVDQDRAGPGGLSLAPDGASS